MISSNCAKRDELIRKSTTAATTEEDSYIEASNIDEKKRTRLRRISRENNGISSGGSRSAVWDAIGFCGERPCIKRKWEPARTLNRRSYHNVAPRFNRRGHSTVIAPRDYRRTCHRRRGGINEMSRRVKVRSL